MKKLALVLAAVVMFTAIPAYADDRPPCAAASYILYEPQTETVLAEKDADDRMLIASTTKIMTALIVLRDCSLTDTVTVEPAWCAQEGSSMYLRPGEDYSVEDLLYGMMLVSGNDAATALACHTAGSVEDFALRMNALAAELGLDNTRFENACGLDAEGHYSSARDLARLTAYAIGNGDFVRIVSTRSRTVRGQTLYNHNKLLGQCEGVFGVKTGYTMAAGRTLVSACERGGMTLICVTLSDRQDWEDHAALYDWGYSHFKQTPGCELADDLHVTVIGGEKTPVIPAQDFSVVTEAEAELTAEYFLPPFVFPGLEKGTELGFVRVYSRGRLLGESPLYLGCDLPQTEQPLSKTERVRRFWKLAGRNIYSF